MEMIAYIVKDGIEGENVFFVRFYNDAKEIALGKRAFDVYECKDVIVDSDTAKYIRDITEEENANAKQI